MRELFLAGTDLAKGTSPLERAKREVLLIEVKLTVSFYLVLVNCTESVPRLASTISPKPLNRALASSPAKLRPSGRGGHRGLGSLATKER